MGEGTEKRVNGLTTVELCCLKECQAKLGDSVALCAFKLPNRLKNKKVVDLTIHADKSFEEIQEALDQETRNQAQEAIHRITQGRTPRSPANNPQTNIEALNWIVGNSDHVGKLRNYVRPHIGDAPLRFINKKIMSAYFQKLLTIPRVANKYRPRDTVLS